MNKKFLSAFGALLFCLLLSSTVFAAPAAEKVSTPFSGSLRALEIAVFDPVTQTASVTANGSGNATQLGRFTYSYMVTISPQATGTLYYHFVAANGDSLYSIGEGTGSPTDKPNTFLVVETHTITGGTGRFAGATGNFKVKRLIIQPDGVTWGTFDGDIVLANDN